MVVSPAEERTKWYDMKKVDRGLCNARPKTIRRRPAKGVETEGWRSGELCLNHCKAKALGEKALHHPADHIVVIYETRRNTRHARSTTTKDISIIPLFH